MEFSPQSKRAISRFWKNSHQNTGRGLKDYRTIFGFCRKQFISFLKALIFPILF